MYGLTPSINRLLGVGPEGFILSKAWRMGGDHLCLGPALSRSIPRLTRTERFMVEVRRHSLPRHGTDHDSKPLPRVSGALCTSTPTSVPTRRASKWPYDRARVRPQSARAAICRRPDMTN